MSASPFAARAFFRDPVGYVRLRGGDLRRPLRFAAAHRPVVLLRDPDAIWRVLVTDADAFAPGKWKRRARRFLGSTLNTLHGAEHRERRTLLQPALDRRRVAAFDRRIAGRCERAVEAWDDRSRLCLRETLDPLSLEVAGDVLLSTDLSPVSRELASALGAVMAAVPRLTPPLRGTPRGRALARVDALVRDLVARRRTDGVGDDGDLLAALLRSGLPDETVRGEVTAFLLAAVDEPPSALEAAFYLLARNPAAEARLHAELDAAGAALPTAGDGARTYLDAVLRETLRLYPPARHIDRCPAHAVELGEARIAGGANVLVSPLVTHREPALYEDAPEFVPERWLDGEGRRPRGSYLPFGAGPHTCIGEPLATAIVRHATAAIARRWRLRVDPSAAEPAPRASPLVVALERR